MPPLPLSVPTLQVVSSPSVGGREIYVPVLSRQLLALGHPTWVMCRPGTLVEKLAKEWNLPLFLTRFTGYFNPLEIVKTAWFIRKNRIRVIHAHWSRDLSNLILASRLAGRLPVVLTKHVYSTQRKRDVFHDWVYRSVAKAIGVSKLVSENMLHTTALSPQQVITIYNGIDIQTQWNPGQLPRQDLRQELGVPPAKPILGYVGRINHGKGPHIILEAFLRVAAEFPDWHFVLVGKAVGEQEEAYQRGLQAKIQNHPAGSRVHFAGYRLDMPAVMRTFDVLAMASEFESLGMVLVEAMAMERPVLGPDTGGVPEIIEPGVCGEIFTFNQPDTFTDKLRLLLADGRRRQRLGKQGREIVLKKFNLDLSARAVVEQYQLLLDRDGGAVTKRS